MQLPEVVVAADRLPSRTADEPFSITRIGSVELRGAPQLRLDDILRNAAPGFSLFRRSSSRVANPTAQGVSLRNVGPNGAGRTLVLLDGIPLNDPFAGWIPWSRVPPSSLGEVLVNPGGGAGLFGNAALAGTIHLVSEKRAGNSANLVGTVANRDTYETALDSHVEAGPLSLSTYLNRFETGGYPVLQADQRGPVDASADAASWTWQSRAGWTVDENTQLSLTASAFEEKRNNGTRLTHNSSDGQDVSATFDRFIPTLDANVRLQAYAQRRRFSSTFSSVNETRTEETLALDQFDVPANAVGSSAAWSQQISEAHRVIGGADVRWIEGETNELFFRVDDAFTRFRNAGGRQLFIGAFLEENWRISEAVKVVAGGRVDYWQQAGGRRFERERATGETLRDEEFSRQEGVAPNGRLGISAQLARSLRIRSAAYTGFRVPTLNELYRPFRVANDITEANAALEPERLLGAEVGADWDPVERFSFSATGFYNQLEDAVGNVTIGEGPGTFAPGGFVPAGGVLRQRQNLDRVEVVGFETQLVWKPTPDLRVRAQYLFTHPTVARAAQSPQLEGKRLAQAPDHVAVAALEWSPGRWHTAAQIRYVGRQFEDDLNRLPLAHFATIDLSLGYEFNDHLTGSARVENLLDTETEVGRTANGLVTIGAPRLFSFTIALQF
ncbi:MAG: putative TonB-dependent receptor [Chthoniobacter sp.]|nr:putative TonB-dependent receptor [Chthoniobacter sp.]